VRVAVRHGPDQGDAVNQTLVVPTEYEDVQREFPILIRKDTEGRWASVALLGLERGENLFLENGRWTTRYVPAVHRRGPFFLALRESEAGERSPELALQIDLDDPRVGDEDGQPLFKEHGGHSAYLDHVESALHIIQGGLAAAQHMFAAFEELGLIQPVEIEAQLAEGRTYTLPSFHTIGIEQFQSLAGPQLERLHRSGFLVPALFIRASLPNINRLIDLKNRKSTEG